MPRTASGVVVFGLASLAAFIVGAALYQVIKPYLPGFIQSKVGV